ncbi:MAG: glycosyltransferase family 2 protein [Acidobacteria bacterium]|nr:glycosyltransferase family 2 protein [Acidobacteriota bacterium]
MKLSVIVPCFNEEDCLPLLLARAATVLCEAFDSDAELIAIDDGSADRTWPVLQQLAQQYSFLVTQRHTHNRGLAEAWQTGALVAQGELVCTLDADLQYRPEEIYRLYRTLTDTKVDIVQGARIRVGQSSDARRLLSRGLNILLNNAFGMSLEDNKSGFLLCRRDVFLTLLNERRAFRHFQAMIMVAAHQLGFSSCSVPTPFDGRAAGQSFLGQIPFRVTAEVMADVLRGVRRYRFAKK